MIVLNRQIDEFGADRARLMFDFLLLYALKVRAKNMVLRRSANCCRTIYQTSTEVIEIPPMPEHLQQSAVAHFADVFELKIPTKQQAVEISLNGIESAEVQYEVFGLSSVDIARITLLNNDIEIADCKSAIQQIFGANKGTWLRNAVLRLRDRFSQDPYSVACRKYSRTSDHA